MAGRYDGKPFLRFLECYILWAIDELSPLDAEALEKLTPKLQQTFKRRGTWQEIVATEMSLPQGRPEAIVRNWVQNKERALSQGKAAAPEDFAKFLADHLRSPNVFGAEPPAN